MLSTTTTSTGNTLITIPGAGQRIDYTIGTGDQAMLSNDVRRSMLTPDGRIIDGTGIKIGIMSDSSNNAIALNGTSVISNPLGTAISQGLLPDPSQINVIQDSTAGADEGLAMAELVHQVAPGAQIDFYTAIGQQDDFAAGVSALVADGCNIIVDDWSVAQTPFFQIAGPIDDAVQNTISHNVDYFTAASNYDASFFQSAWDPISAQLSLPDPSDPSINTLQDVTAQQFSNGTTYQTITVPDSVASTTVVLQWDAPWPAIGDSVPDALGMALYDTSGNLIRTSVQNSYRTGSGASQAVTTLPEISLSITAPGTYHLAIYQASTAASFTQFKYALFGKPPEAIVPGGAIDDPGAGLGSGLIHGGSFFRGSTLSVRSTGQILRRTTYRSL